MLVIFVDSKYLLRHHIYVCLCSVLTDVAEASQSFKSNTSIEQGDSVSRAAKSTRSVRTHTHTSLPLELAPTRHSSYPAAERVHCSGA